MRAISIRQPYLWAILYAGKRVENRPRPCSYRGPVLLHASLGVTRLEFEAGVHAIAAMRGGKSDLRQPVPELKPAGSAHACGNGIVHMPRGGLVGIARIVDCKPNPPMSERVRGDWRIPSDEDGDVFGLVLADVRPLPFVPLKGQLAVPFNAEPGLDLALRSPNMAGNVAAYRAAWRTFGGT